MEPGEIISDILEPMARMEDKPAEAQSTEELLRNIKDTNTAAMQQGVGGRHVVAGSMDVSTLSKPRPGNLCQNY